MFSFICSWVGSALGVKTESTQEMKGSLSTKPSSPPISLEDTPLQVPY
jgi:hypothetical protein